MGSVLGAWLGAFPIPLDWDRPWQVSLCIGITSTEILVFGLRKQHRMALRLRGYVGLRHQLLLGGRARRAESLVAAVPAV